MMPKITPMRAKEQEADHGSGTIAKAANCVALLIFIKIEKIKRSKGKTNDLFYFNLFNSNSAR